MFRNYRELRRLDTFMDRFEYLSLKGQVGETTFGHGRHLNQDFYRSREWKLVRDEVIVRDNGCDLGVPGHEIFTELLVHHMEPMTLEDIIHGEDWIVDPNYLITTNKTTHNAIHFGNASLLPRVRVDRAPGDTKLW